VTVYVDDAFDGEPGSWGKWTGGGHMQADTVEELHAMASKIGLKRAWFQTKPNRPERDHYDLTRSKRKLAVQKGVIQITWREAGRMHHAGIRKRTSKAIAYSDGSGNSGRIQACACQVTLDNDTTLERTILLPPYTSNNVGEYSGVILAMQTALDGGVKRLILRSDSQLIVNQVLGKWDCKNKDLATFLAIAQEGLKQFDKFQIEWVPREQNATADALCRKAIKQAKKNPFVLKQFEHGANQIPWNP
jgi:ribonuclease HI